ncbi:MAG: M14 family metallopeptidase [Parvularculaceae bacterium]
MTERKCRRILSGAAAASLLGAGAVAAQPGDLGGLPADEAYGAAIRDATTDERYLTPWVAALPDHPTIPSPMDYLGRIAGAPGELTQVDQIHGYMRAIADATPRAQVVSLGVSEEGREMVAIIISDEANIRDLDQYKARLNALADPRGLDEAEAEATIAASKPIYWITAGLHSPELGPPETAIELAYRLAAEERDVFRNIRRDVITMITPVLEVDGRTRQVEWYYQTQKGLTDYFDRPPRSVPFWGHYTRHDNNRDGLAMSQPLTRNALATFLEYKPTLSLDMHESVPLLYVSTGTGPYNMGVSPRTISEWQAVANYEVQRLTGFGLPGVWTWGFYTGWYPGYVLWITNNRNSHGRFYETFGNGSAETMRRDLSRSRYAGDLVTTRQWYRADPPEEEILWSMRNNTNYMQSSAIASLEYAAKNARDLVENFYRKSADAIRAGVEDAPHAILIPAAQRDRGAARDLIDLMILQGIEVRVAERGGEFGDVEITRGDALIRLDQPYGPFARNLFEDQDFPSDVDVPPYDDVAWTMGYLRGVDTKMIDDAGVFELRSSLVESGDDAFPASGLPRAARYWVVPHRGQERLGAFLWAVSGAPVMAAREEVRVGGETYPAGTFFVDGSALSRDALREALGDSLLDVAAASRLPDVAMAEIDLPRIGLLHSWVTTQDPGWMRYTFDQAGIPYDLIEKDRLKRGGLRAEYDVVIAPKFGSNPSLATLVGGIDPKWSPLPYETTQETPSLGRIVSSPDITGGFGAEGLAALHDFMKQGGTFIGVASGGVLAVESGMVHGVGVSRPAGMNTPGSVIRVKLTDRTSPLTFGYEEMTHAFRGNGPLFTVGTDDRHLAVAQFGVKPGPTRPWDRNEEAAQPDDKRLVLSGGIISGANRLDGAPAIVTKPVGDGQAVLYAWNPMHRYVNHHDHAFLYNALAFWNDLK